jgi:hypothetical protein
MNENLINILTDFELLDENGEASASITHNPQVSWAKFVFTDDQPNANKQQIPKDEFPNILRTGTLMPIKMATGKINDGHDDATPLGVISHLKEDGNKIIGLAALWTTERESDVQLLKSRNADGKPPQLSWEVLYDQSKSPIVENDIRILHDTIVKAITVVGMPAYQGRTPMLAMANENTSESASTEETVNEEELKAKIAQLEAEVARLTTDLASKDQSLTGQTDELASLREFKTSVEKKEADASKFAEIKTLFKDAGVVKEDTYFDTNKERLMGLEKEALSFMLQEMIAFSSNTTQTPTSASTINVPPITAPQTSKLTPVELAKALRELSIKNQ